MEQHWLKCIEIVEGMFSDEKTVTVTRLGGQEESFFVPKSAIEKDRLRVGVSKSGIQTWVTLPTPERTQIAVAEDQLDA